jgi:hypothetical protein
MKQFYFSMIASLVFAGLGLAQSNDHVGTITLKPELTILAAVGDVECLFARGLGDSILIQCAADVGTTNIKIEVFTEAQVRVNTNGANGSFRNISWHFTRKANGELDFDILALKLEQTGSLPPL